MTRPLSFRVAEPEPEFVPYRHRGIVMVGAVLASWVICVGLAWLAVLAGRAMAAMAAAAGVL